MSTLNNMLLLVLTFAIMSVIIFINHEINNSHGSKKVVPDWVFKIPQPNPFMNVNESKNLRDNEVIKPPHVDPPPSTLPPKIVSSNLNKPTQNNIDIQKDNSNSNSNKNDDTADFGNEETEKRGKLICGGKEVDSEVIFWKKVKGDRHYESPITPHHDNHHDKYLTFEYDNGGWNNVRMSLECLIVLGHATGRTLVTPPQQHMYLLGETHQDKHDEKPHDEMGFEDFFDMDLLKSHQGFHMMTMTEFLEKEAATGGLNPQILKLPNNNTRLWGRDLWYYLNHVADATPAWSGKFMIFPDHPSNFNQTRSELEKKDDTGHTKQRLDAFAGERKHVFYDHALQQVHHIHIRGDENYRVLQHHYAFTFFESPEMQSFYKRFIRDYVRYKDSIQCAGSELVAAVRADSLRVDPSQKGRYYALHIRRGDFQFKNVKISASEMITNLNITGPDGRTNIIPPGSMVYISTDDPDGVCKGCFVNRKNCNTYPAGRKPVGCPEDPSWKAFKDYGWNLRFLNDYLKQGYIKDANPNTYGMVESIVCSRANVFAGTYFSTFTGYIHRMRGYHGLGEATYYHHRDYVHHPLMKKSVGHGFSREWRAGWTDDGGELI